MSDTFTGLPASLAQSDPEFVTYIGALATEEVPGHSGDLPERTRLLVQLGAVIATGAQAEYRLMLDAALSAGVSPVEAKEVIYQAVPYVGLGRALDALLATNEVLSAHGVDLPLPGQSTTTPADRLQKGRAVQEEIVGTDTVANMYATAPADEAHIQELLSANCFGDHYTRTGLDIPTRELLTFAILAGLGGADPQVRGHVAANLNVGSDRAALIAVVTALLPFIGYPRTLNALRAVDEVAPVK